MASVAGMATVTASAEAVLGQLAEQTGALVAAVRAGLLAGQPVERLGAVLAGARRVQAQLDWVLLAVAGEVDRSGGYAVDGALTPQAWLRHRARLAPGEAARTVRAARAFASGQLAATGAALAAGDIDGGHARLIAAAAAEAPPGAVALIEPLALDAARDYSAPEVARLLARFRYALDPDGADAAAVRRYEQRGLSAAATLHGMVAGRFLLDPVAGASLATATARRNAGAHPHLLLTAATSDPQRPGSGGRPGGAAGWPASARPGSPGSGRCPPAPPTGSAATPTSSPPRCTPTATSPRWPGGAASSPGPSGWPSSPATGTPAPGPGATGPSGGATPTTCGLGRTAAPPPWPTRSCPAPGTTSCSTKAAGGWNGNPTAAT